MGNNLINDIKAPGLSQSGYGAGIKKVFNQIDANFKILGNRDFVKGDKGWSIGHNEIYIMCTKQDNKTYFTKEGIDVLNTIIRETKATDQQYEYQDDEEHQNIVTVKAWLNTIDALKSITTKDEDGNDVELSLIDGITPGDLFNEITVYDPINPDNKHTIGATNDYVFKDRRFVVGMDDYDETYSSLYDCSCTVHLQVYEEEDPDTGIKTPAKKFVVIQNAPTLYFDKDVQAFCWRIGGTNTGLIAQGPKGESGQNATFYIVQVGEPIESPEQISDAPAGLYTKKVAKYMDNNGGWVNLAEHSAPSDFKDANCIAFEPTNIDGDETPPTSYFGKITAEGDSFVVSCTNDNRIQTNLNLNWLAATFASIGTSKALKGLFVPIEYPVPDSDETYNDESVHAIWHASTKDRASIFSELHISPMDTYAGIDEAANTLSGIDRTKNNRLDEYSNLIYSDASLVFDYKSVIFFGHANDNDDENGVRIGIGTNNIFNDSVGSNSVVRFSNDSKVDMPGNSQAIISNIYTKHISTPVGTDDVIDLACKTLNISGKDGKNVVVNIGGDIHLKNHLIFENNVVSDGVSVNQIKIEEQSGIDRHLDVRTDGLYLSKRNYGEYNSTGDDTKSVHQYIDGHLDVLGHTHIKRGATINGGVTIANNTQDGNGSQIKVELGSITLSSQYDVYKSSIKIGPDETNINSPTTRIERDFSVHGATWLHTLLFSDVDGEEVPIVNTDTVGVEKYIRAKTGGTISGQNIKMGWQIDDLPSGTIIIVNGGNPSGWATPATDSDRNGNYVWCPDRKQYIGISGGIYIVLIESGIKRLYCVSSHYHEQGYLK